MTGVQTCALPIFLDKSIPPVIEVGTPVGYILRFDNGVTVYDTGDTGLDINYEMIQDFYKPDIMISTNSRIYQAGPEEVAWLATKIDPEFILPSHHGSFPFYPKDANRLQEEVDKRRSAGETRAQVIDPKVGETFKLKGLKFTWLGHATYVIETQKGSRIIIDPEWNAVNNGYPVEYRDPNDKGGFDLILLTHGHFDHYDPKAIEALMKPSANHNPILSGVFELVAYTQKLIPEVANRMAPINIGVWINKNEIFDAYGVEATNLDDVNFAAVWSSHSSGVTR